MGLYIRKRYYQYINLYYLDLYATYQLDYVHAIQYNKCTNNIGILRVNRPAARNALNWVAQKALAEQISNLAKEPPAVLILTGTGDKVFIAGGDLHELTPDLKDGEQLNRIVGDALKQLKELPCIVIGASKADAVRGRCNGRGASPRRIRKTSDRCPRLCSSVSP